MPTLLCDACLLITLGGAGALHLLRDMPGWRVCTCRRAAGEVVRPPAAAAVTAAIEEGWLELLKLDLDNATEARALADYDAQPAFRHRADAEILALARTRGCVVGTDDARVRREALRFGPDRVAGCLDVLVICVRAGVIDVAAADALLARFDLGSPDIDIRDLI